MNNWRTMLLSWLNVNVAEFTWVEQLLFAAIILALVAIIDRVTKLILNRVLTRLVRATTFKWDDILLDQKVLNKLVALFPAILLVLFLPFVFAGNAALYDLTQRLCWIYFVGVLLALIVAALTALTHILEDTDSFRNKPVKGAVQMLQVIVIVLAIIIMISIMVDKSPAFLLTGLGASAAVLMLVFQDLILGLVAGIQLSANKMMQVGDWVEVKDKGIDGMVIEITLTTVKVQNWNYTISTIQPQALVNGSFVNWSNMFRSGGRRVARTVNIDLHSVRFMTAEELAPWRENALVSHFVDSTLQRIDEARSRGDELTAQSLRITNLTLFRHYIQSYIQMPAIANENFLSMVRLMEPTQYGVPMQLYFFTKDTAWIKYESVQSSVFEYLFAVAPEFGIRLFQLPSGDDIEQLKS
ncbi:MAG: mechanosensitive ion channel [Bacteroidaceae bacterium]|nr:mechanosensitive ion channel [Bacteroidaceae bacterium]